MRFKKGLYGSLFAATLGILSMAGAVSAAQDIVATIGSVPVTRYELQREVQRIIPLQMSYHSGLSKEKVEKIQEEAFTRLVERNYKANYAVTEKIAIKPAEVDKRLAAVTAKFKSTDALEKALGDEGLQGFKASIYRQLLAEKAEEKAVISKVNINEEDVAKFYKENEKTFKRPKQFKASHILVKVDPASNGEERKLLRKRADELAEKARTGEDFYNLAYYNSDDRSKYVGGDLGYFHEGQTASEFESALQKMQPGEISAPVQTRFGYHIIKLVEVNESRQLSLEEVRDKIREKLETQRRAELHDAWMESLREKYPVERMAVK